MSKRHAPVRPTRRRRLKRFMAPWRYWLKKTLWRIGLWPDVRVTGHDVPRIEIAANFPILAGTTAMLAGDPCAYCGEQAMTRDHIVPISAGGRITSYTNLTASCYSCNQDKANLSLLRFLVTGKPMRQPSSRYRRTATPDMKKLRKEVVLQAQHPHRPPHPILRHPLAPKLQAALAARQDTRMLAWLESGDTHG